MAFAQQQTKKTQKDSLFIFIIKCGPYPRDTFYVLYFITHFLHSNTEYGVDYNNKTRCVISGTDFIKIHL